MQGGIRSQAPTSSRRAVMIAAAVNAASALPLFLVGALAVQMRAELGFDRAALGVAVATLLGAASASSVALGRLSQRIGSSAGMRLGAGLTALVCAAVATAARSYPQLLALLALGGMALAVAEASSNLWLGQQVRGARLGAAFGYKQGALPASALLAGVSVPALALTVGWRSAWAAAAVLAVVAALAVPRRPSKPSGAERAPRAGRTPTGALVILSVASGCGFSAATSLGAFLVDSSVALGHSPGSSGLLLAGASLSAVGVRVGLGQIADRRAERGLVIVAVLLLGGAAGHLLLATRIPDAVAVGAVLGYGLGYGWAGLFFFSVARLNPQRAGAASGVVLTGGFLGSLSGPLVFGALAESASYRAAWLATAVLAAAGAGTMLLAQRRVRRLVLDNRTDAR